MIKANELRIGNWVEYLGKYVQCDINTIYAISKIVDESKIYNPIPLTPEILEKCGFVWWKQEETGRSYLIADLKNASLELAFNKGRNDMMSLFQRTAPIDSDIYPLKRVIHFGSNHPNFIHELQNLYFALTGEELNVQEFPGTIKP
jgi:hypothetical protein